jgi:DNA polymerase-3 subunit beta
VDVPAGTLRDLIERTSFSISPDETRLHLNSALFQGDGKVLRMVTTDGHRMTCCEAEVEGSERFYRHEVLLPARGIAELKRLLEGIQGEVRVVFEAPNVFFELPETAIVEEGKEGPGIRTRLAVKLVDATFPPYRQVVPRDNKRTVVVSRQDLANALRRISSISPTRTPTGRLHFEPGRLKISSDNPDVGVGEEEMDAEYDGEAIDIGFNTRYLLDVLGVMRSDNAVLNLGGALDGCIVKDEDEGDRFLAVVMPIRI